MTQNQLLEQARLTKAGQYPVRSRHLNPDATPKFTNHLILEDSPYLLQHAHNPVNWYAYSDEAFALAERDNKPVFLSIGYATCHWCHVMEEESFDNLEVAAILNRDFISIKVDREQRPDLDDIYMTAAMLITGRGGWPLNSFLMADGKAFFAATYFPRQTFIDILARVKKKWRYELPLLVKTAEKITRGIVAQESYTKGEQSTEQSADALAGQAISRLLATEDQTHGGMGDAPKFPNEPNLMMLIAKLQRMVRPTESQIWGFVSRALNGMLQGGIYDQLGGGFHRYATDNAWLLPHFEKMLYNQAQLAQIYTLAWQLSGDPEYRRIAIETLDYVLREMRARSGCFYSATDADSEGSEGKFFVWEDQQISDLLGAEQAALVKHVYGISFKGNFEGSNILYLPRSLADVADGLKLSREELLSRLAPLKSKLLEERNRRVAPFLDQKEITEWNAMMILALVQAGLVCKQGGYIEAATECAEQIWKQMRDAQGRLYRIFVKERASVQGTLADYGYYIQALMALYDASEDPKWLQRGQSLYRLVTARFADPKEGGFYNSAPDSQGPLLFRSKSAQDNITASGNSSMLMAMVMLYQRSGTFEIKLQIKRQLAFFAPALNRQPMALAAMLTALDQYRSSGYNTVGYGAGGRIRIEAMKDQTQITVMLSIAPGWHINSHNPLDSDLIPTRIRLLDVDLTPVYPPGKVKTLGFNRAPMSLYQDKVEIPIVTGGGDLPAYLLAEVSLQACDNNSCLTPEKLFVALPSP